MNPDFPSWAFTLAGAAFFIFAAAAATLTIDLGKTPDSQPISLGISRTDTNRIEFPETIINAFSSSELMDVKIIGRSVLVRAEDPAELIILTEKRRLTLLLVPEDGPSQTIIMRDGDEPSPNLGRETAGGVEALPYEKAITDLVLSLASKSAPAKRISEKEQKLSGSLFLARRGQAVSPPFFAALYVVRNGGSASAALAESMFSSDPQTVAVGMERDELQPGESSQVFVVTKKEPTR